MLVRWRRMQAITRCGCRAPITRALRPSCRRADACQRRRQEPARPRAEEFTKRVWQWKDKYGSRIIEQLRVLGFSLDWQRCRFTMDEGLSRAVVEAFVRLYEDGLIYRARRLINWCTRCYTALSDLEVEAEETDGKLWHIAYPVVGSK